MTQVPLHSEWWVVKTQRGWKPVDYRPNCSSEAVGPFSMSLTAGIKVAELEARSTSRRLLVRGVCFIAGLMAGMGAASVLLP